MSRGKILAEMGRRIAQATNQVDIQSEEEEPFQSSGSEYIPSDIEQDIGHVTEGESGSEKINKSNDMCVKNGANNLLPSTSTGRAKKGRKRKYENQNRDTRKKMCNINKPYISAKGKEIVAKNFDNDFKCQCKKKCTDIVSNQERSKIFSQFRTMGSFSARCALIKSCVKETRKKRCYTKQESRRKYTRKYYIGEKEICKKAFLKTLQINQNRIDLALQKTSNNMEIVDERGTKSGGKNKCTEDQVSKIIEHINSFPKYVSHYCRKETNANFLSPDLNLNKMYDLYKAFCNNSKSVSLATYKSTFYTKFDLKFKPPKKDTCVTCDTFKVKILSALDHEKENLQTAHDSHVQESKNLRDKMNEDLLESKTNPELETLTFDMQKTHPIPKIPTGIAYYKRQLNFYNLGIHVGSQNQGIFNVWTENDAGKGTQEVGSCLLKYIKEHIRAPVKELRLWSDSCGGQNRSIKLVLLLIHALLNHPTIEKITLRFLLSGHSFLPNDSEFSDVESALRVQERLYTDNDYMAVMAKCRRKRKFLITRIQKNDFLSVENLVKAITNRKVDVAKNKVSWLSCHEILLNKDQPTTLFMRSNLIQEHQKVSIEKQGKGRKPSIKDIELPLLWPHGKPISSEKLKDLKEMYKLIPKDVQQFYKVILSSITAEFQDDVDGFGASIDFDAETGLEDDNGRQKQQDET